LIQGARFLITGGCGFLGRWLVKEILHKYPEVCVRIIDLKGDDDSFPDKNGVCRVEIITGGDICDAETVRDAFEDIDTVFHLAGVVSFALCDKALLYRVNVEGCRNVMTLALEKNVSRAVHVSSVAALGYGDRDHEPIDEDYEFDWTIAERRKKHYMISKRQADLEIEKTVNRGLNCVTVHPGLMFGPGDRVNSARFVEAIRGGRIPFNMPGGTNVVDVRDVAKGIVCACEKGRGGKHYLLSGHNLTFAQINGAVAKHVGGKPPRFTLHRALNTPLYHLFYLMEKAKRGRGEVTADNVDSAFKFRYFDNSRAKSELGWEPLIPFEQTVIDTVKWLDGL